MIRTMQIIALSLPVGVIVFAMIAVFVAGALDQPPTGTFMSLIAVGFAFVAFVMHVAIPSLIAKSMNETQDAIDSAADWIPRWQVAVPEPQRPYMMYQTQMIVKLALLEGAAIFNVTCSLIEHNWWSLAIAGLLVGWMLTQFPTLDRVERWIAERGIAGSE